MSIRRVAVCGGGHGALAVAADLALRGLEVRLALRNRERFGQLFETGRLRVEGTLEGEVTPALVTTDHAEAVRGADVVVVPLPAPAQVEMARTIAPAVSAGQVLYVTKGTLGAPLLAAELARGGAPEVPIVENAILPYGTRVSGPASVRIGMVAEYLPSGVYPASRSAEGLAVATELYPATLPAVDVLDVALLNSDPALHAPLVLMNAGPIENLAEFDIHTLGNPPSVVAVSIALDEERLALRRALGYGGEPWPLENLYSRTKPTYYGVITRERMGTQSVWREKIGFDHRYVSEDVGCGLALWSSLGRAYGVPTPLADSFLALASAATGLDYAHRGRTLASLGLAGLAVAELRDRLREGTAHRVPTA
jgi:opine dehydrogenase